MISASSGTRSSTVAGTYQPRVAGTGPRATSRAPRASASSTKPPIFVTAASLIIGPSPTPSAIPGPMWTDIIASASRSVNSPAIDSWT
jgi:hypothetical protein